MKKQFIFLLILAVMFSNLNTFSYANENLSLSAETAILMDAESGDILFEKDSSKKMFPASTTKILTAIIAIENSDLSQKVIIDEETSSGVDGSSMSLMSGEVLSMEDLVHALLISSANDSAVAIAKHISGSVENFSKLMNQEAIKMGAKNSNFLNPNGLPDENHTSTAYDLAIIGKYAMKNDMFREIVKKTTYTIEATNKKSEPRVLKNSNKLLYSDEKIKVNGKSASIKYDGVQGIKTGYTKAAQQCLVSSVNKSGKEYISVILHSIGSNIYIDTHKLFNYASKNSKPTVLAKKNEFIDNISIKGGNIPFITAVFATDFSITPSGEDMSHIERELITEANLKPPISKGQVIGKINFTSDDKLLGSANIISSTQVVKSDFELNNVARYLIDKWWFWFLVSLIVLRIAVGIKRVFHRAKKLKRKRKISRKKGQTVS